MNVAVLVCEGLSNRQIAERTGRAESTIDQQRMMARLKLGARSTAALIHAMIAKKLWSPT
jgi:DNA-binding NarL/FixJ family response regulator